VYVFEIAAGRHVYSLLVALATGVLGGLVFARLLLALRESEGLWTTLSAQNERLRQLDTMKDNFVATVSHELRTPLTSIRGYLELVLEEAVGELNDEQRRFLTIVDRNSDRLLRLVGDLLFVAQADAGRIALDRTDVDLGSVVQECAQSARPAAERSEVELRVEAAPVPPVAADRARLAQLVDNLLSNALKFTPPGGQVTLRAGARDSKAVLEVADPGIGIPPEEQTHLFERFFRTSAASERATQGTELGLAIAKAIAESHDGTISVKSAEGEGTTFRVELPLGPLEPNALVAAGQVAA
jgi:signal transduction histidine kinase